jgi:phage terminase Nu1 subunit (DNA packaging protein)
MNKQLLINAETTPAQNVATDNNHARFGTKRAVADLMDMSIRSVNNFMSQGMPYVSFGARTIRFDLEEVRAWLKERYGKRRLGRAGKE